MHPPTAGPVPLALAALAAGLFAASPALAGSDRVHRSAAWVSYAAAVPEGAAAVVDVTYDAGGSTGIGLRVAGLAPRHRYAGRVHRGGCPVQTEGLGEVFELMANPSPRHPEDPAYRNPVNEVWFDLVTDRSGAGWAHATQPWQFAPQDRPGAVVLHEVLPQERATDPAVGAALGCVEVRF